MRPLHYVMMQVQCKIECLINFLKHINYCLFFGKLQFFPKGICADKNPFLMSEFLTLTAQANAVFMSQFTSLIF